MSTSTSPKTPDEIKQRLQGPVTSIPVSFTRDGEVDWTGIRNIIEAGIAGGSGVMLLTYGDSQFDLLSEAEHVELTRVLAEQTRGRALTVAANRRWAMRENLEYAGLCRELGIDLLMCLQIDVMLLARPNMDHAGYYKSIAAQIPVMLMGWPEFPIVDSVLDDPNVCAFKEDGYIDYGIAACRRYGERLTMMAGGGLGRHYVYWPYGCRAFMSIWPALKPEMDQRYWQALHSDDHVTAKELIHRDWSVMEASDKYPGTWQAFWRGWFEHAGIAERYLRAPLRHLNDEEMEKLKGELQQLGAL